MPKTTKEICEEYDKLVYTDSSELEEPQEHLKNLEDLSNYKWFSEFEVDEIKKKLKDKIEKAYIELRDNDLRYIPNIEYESIIDSVFDEVTKK